MTKRTKAELKTQTGTLFPDNTSQDIDEQRLRTGRDDVIDSMRHVDDALDNVSAGNLATRLAAQLAEGANISITQSGNNFTIAATDTNTDVDVSAANLATRLAAQLIGGTNVTITRSGNNFTINSTASGGSALTAQGLVDLINNSEGNVDAALDSTTNKIKLTAPAGGGGSGDGDVLADDIYRDLVSDTVAAGNNFQDTGEAKPTIVANGSYRFVYTPTDTTTYPNIATLIVDGEDVNSSLQTRTVGTNSVSADLTLENDGTTLNIRVAQLANGNFLVDNQGIAGTFKFQGLRSNVTGSGNAPNPYDDRSLDLNFGSVTGGSPWQQLRTVTESGGTAIDIPAAAEQGGADGGFRFQLGEYYVDVPFRDILDIPVDATNDTTIDTSGNTQNALSFRSATTTAGYQHLYVGHTSADKLLLAGCSNDGSTNTDNTSTIRVWVIADAHRGSFERSTPQETALQDTDLFGFFDASGSFQPPKLITFANLKTAIGGSTPVTPPDEHEQAYFGAQSGITDANITNYVLADMHSADVQNLGASFTMWDPDGNTADGNDNRSGIYLESMEYLVLLVPANRDGDTLQIHDVATNSSTKDDYTRLTNKRTIGGQAYNVYYFQNPLSIAVYKLDSVIVATS